MPGEKFYFLGTISKTYGIEGDVVIIFDDHATEANLKKLKSVFIEIDGQRIPFFISRIKNPEPDSAVLKFDTVDSPDNAKSLSNRKVYTNLSGFFPDRTSEFDIGTLKGFMLYDIQEGKIGTIEEVLQFPHNSVLKILFGGKEILIPFDEELIESIDLKSCKIFMNLPDGLIEIFK